MSKRIPKYSRHKASGQAFVRINGRCEYLGKFDSPESRERYERVIAEWLLQNDDANPQSFTVSRIAVLFVKHAREYYRKDGKETSEVSSIQSALRPLIQVAGSTRADEFGPRKLKTVRDRMIRDGRCRTGINSAVNRIKRMLKWAVESELIPPHVYQSCQAVSGLKKGRSAASESPPVTTIPQKHIDGIKPFVSDEIWTMVQLQLLTGMRPGEVCQMRSGDIDRSEQPWTYTPLTHKTAHHDRDRVIPIGPRAQKLLEPLLAESCDEGFLFSPRVAESRRNASRREDRQSPMTPSQAARKPAATPSRLPRDCYDKDSYRRAITRACVRAGVSRWSPNQLRHNAATRFRKEFGLETARAILGHTESSTTLHYAEVDLDSARDAIAAVG